MPPQDIFGSTDSRRMPEHLFYEATHIDHSTAIPADIRRQNYSVCPRHWYVDAEFTCRRCAVHFLWKAAEQKTWFEEYQLWIDARPSTCLGCRRDLRHLTELRKEYDAGAAAALHGTPAQKQRIIAIIDELCQAGEVPPRMIETRRIFQRQLAPKE